MGWGKKRGKKETIAHPAGGGVVGVEGTTPVIEKSPPPAPPLVPKYKTIFKCSAVKCGLSWDSIQSKIWKPKNKVYCEFCFVKAQVVNVVDETVDLDCYKCDCGDSWKSIHDPTAEERTGEECYRCGEIVDSNGVQKQFGRHYWFSCMNTDCPEKPEWEDFSLTPEQTQDCNTCKSRGDIVKIIVMKSRKNVLGKPGKQKKKAAAAVLNVNIFNGSVDHRPRPVNKLEDSDSDELDGPNEGFLEFEDGDFSKQRMRKVSTSSKSSQGFHKPLRKQRQKMLDQKSQEREDREYSASDGEYVSDEEEGEELLLFQV